MRWIDCTDRFPFAFVAFVGFLAACRFAHQPKALDASQNDASVSLEVVSGHESDTDALVAKSGSESQIDDTSEQKQLQQQHQRRSVFQILRLASGTVFGSVSSVVFFLNLFFINIGTNVVEGLVRATITIVGFLLFTQRPRRCLCSSKMISVQAAQFLVSYDVHIGTTMAVSFCQLFVPSFC